MRICYIACMYDVNTFKKKFVKDSKPMEAAAKYHRLMCEGLAFNGVDLETIAILPINNINFEKRISQSFIATVEGVTYSYLQIVNIKYVKHLFLFLSSFIRVLRSKATCLLFDYLNISASKGALLAARIRKIPTICIVTDLVEFVSSNKNYIKMCYKAIQKADAFVLLSPQMNDRVNKLNKPRIFLEGHSNEKMRVVKRTPNLNKKIVLYAGYLDEKYGIVDMCEGFLETVKPGEELHVYGDGPSKEKVIFLSKSFDNIKYFGNVANDIVLDAELRATLLINPRPSNDEFTKYSFPSKIMEYMSTGTPVLMYPLLGIPSEYFNHVFLIKEGNPINEIGSAIRHALDLPMEILNSFGSSAKNFVLDHKNNRIQAKKLEEFIINI